MFKNFANHEKFFLFFVVLLLFSHKSPSPDHQLEGDPHRRTLNAALAATPSAEKGHKEEETSNHQILKTVLDNTVDTSMMDNTVDTSIIPVTSAW